MLKYFYAFILSCFESCSSVWCSAADSYVKLLDLPLNNIKYFLPHILINFEKRRNFDCFHFELCKFYPHYSAQENNKALALARLNINQFSQCFIYSTAQLWISLPNVIVLAVKQDRLKILAWEVLTFNNKDWYFLLLFKIFVEV